MKKPQWVQRETVLALHERLLAEFGGAPGLRDGALLDSALSRPSHRISYAKPTLFDLAASYCFGLVKNHPFLDGNKRIGFTVAVLFLQLNGCQFRATEVDATVQTLALAAGELEEPAYAAWLQASTDC